MSAMDIDDFERQKKRAKVEKILSLSHQDGMHLDILDGIYTSEISLWLINYIDVVLSGIVESLDMPGSNNADKDKDEKMMSPWSFFLLFFIFCIYKMNKLI